MPKASSPVSSVEDGTMLRPRPRSEAACASARAERCPEDDRADRRAGTSSVPASAAPSASSPRPVFRTCASCAVRCSRGQSRRAPFGSDREARPRCRPPRFRSSNRVDCVSHLSRAEDARSPVGRRRPSPRSCPEPADLRAERHRPPLDWRSRAEAQAPAEHAEVAARDRCSSRSLDAASAVRSPLPLPSENVREHETRHGVDRFHSA